MKSIIRIYDFIRSWFYYPRMKRYLSGIGIEYPMSRMYYSLWHCKTGSLSDIGYENLQPTIKDVFNEWEYAYRDKPIERG